MLDQPYLDLSKNKKQWNEKDIYEMRPYWQSWFYWVMGSLFDGNHRILSAFSIQGELINSDDLLLDRINPHLIEAESEMLIFMFRLSRHEVYDELIVKIEEFDKLSLAEKTELLNIKGYLRDRNIKKLYLRLEKLRALKNVTK